MGGQILKYDLSHIRGQEIVEGNPEHCINLLQLVDEISGMLQNKESQEQSHKDSSGMKMDQEDDEAEVVREGKQRSSQKKGRPRSHSDDKGGKQFEMDDFDISNEFDVNMGEQQH